MKQDKLTISITNYNVCPWPLCLLTETLGSRFHELGGPNISPFRIAQWENRVNHMAIDKADYDRATVWYINKFFQNSSWYWRRVPTVIQKYRALTSLSSKIFKADLGKLSNKQLLKLYQDYNQLYNDSYIYGWLGNAPEGLDNSLTKKLTEIISAHAQTGKLIRPVGEYLSVLVSPNKISDLGKEHTDFLHLLIKAKKYPQSKDKLLATHASRYAWLQFDYDGPALGLSHFVSQYNEAIKSQTDSRDELVKLDADRKALVLQQKEYEAELGLTAKKSNYFRLARELMYLKDYRKAKLFQSYYYVDKLIKEIGRRLSLSPIQVKHILPREMPAVLLDSKLNQSEINQRIKYTVLLFNKNILNVYSGDRAKKVMARYTTLEKINKNVRELTGECAYPGELRGTVKIVNVPADMKKVQSGDILVAVATNPNLLPAMKKAAAIVTDKGGITCHAAVVARELKKPCLTGTKYATKIFKDGDIVEVDSGRGVVKKLKV